MNDRINGFVFNILAGTFVDGRALSLAIKLSDFTTKSTSFALDFVAVNVQQLFL